MTPHILFYHLRLSYGNIFHSKATCYFQVDLHLFPYPCFPHSVFFKKQFPFPFTAIAAKAPNTNTVSNKVDAFRLLPAVNVRYELVCGITPLILNPSLPPFNSYQRLGATRGRRARYGKCQKYINFGAECRGGDSREGEGSAKEGEVKASYSAVSAATRGHTASVGAR